MSSSPDETTTASPAPKKRAPRKRATTATAKKAPVKRAPRKTTTPRVKKVIASAKTASAQASAEKEKTAAAPDAPIRETRTDAKGSNTERKAPTRFSVSREGERQRQRQLVVFGLVFMVGIGASAAVGFTDQGQIDVEQTIEARNERIRTNQADARDTSVTSFEVPVQNSRSRQADGGLVGLGNVNAPPPPKPATTTASTTDATASSTDAMSDVEGYVNVDEVESEAVRPEDAPLETPANE